MALFPAYATTSIDTKSTPTISDSTASNQPKDWLRFSSFQPQPPSIPNQPIDQEVIIVDEKPAAPKYRTDQTDDEVVIVEEKRRDRSSSSDHRKRHKRKERKEKRKRRRRSSSSSEVSEEVVSREPKSRKATVQQQSKTKWSLEKSKEFDMGGGEVFVLDNRREIENLQYTTVYKGHLAKFQEGRFRHCLGNHSARIDRLFFGEVIDGNQSKWRRYFKRSKHDGGIGEVQNFVANQSGDGPSSSKEGLPEFVPLDNKTVIDGKVYIYDFKLQMYRPLDTEESGGKEGAEEEFSTTGSSLVMENRRLNRLLAENPYNTDLWRQFLRLQDRLFSENRPRTAKEENPVSNLALLERKMSVLDKAIEKNPTNVELKILRLHIGRECGWDQTRQRDEWRRLEFAHVNDPSMWIGRLQFENGGDFANFSITRLSSLYDHCLERFSTVLSGKLVTHPAPANGEEWLVDFLMAKMRFLFECGQIEQATASLQALLEFNFKQPAALEKIPLEDKRKFFEPFWDSNQSRFGDDGAAGWAETMKRSLKSVEPLNDNLTEEEDELCRRNSQLRDAGLWLELERFRESKQWLPWRSVEEPEDAQRVVLFDDLVGILYEVSDQSNRFRLLLETLKLFGMQVPPLVSSNKKLWYDENSSVQALENFELLPRLRRITFSQGEEFLQRLCLEMEKLFPDSSIHQLFLIYARFGHAATVLAKEEIPTKERLKRYRKMAKAILDDDRWRDQLVLYFAYARGLSSLGSMSDSSSVAEAALVASKTSDSSSAIDQLSTLNLMCLWTENHLFQVTLENSMDVVTERLSKWLVSGIWQQKSGSFSKASILKAKNALSQRLENWMASWKERRLEEEFLVSWIGSVGSLLTQVAALFNYACTNGNLASSREFYSETRQFLKSQEKTSDSLDMDLERLLTWEVRLIEHHLQSNSSAPPRLLIGCLENALEEFPANPLFLKLYIDRHLRGQLMVKLRRFFDLRHENWISNDNRWSSNLEISWMAAIYSEFSRYVKLKEEQADDEFYSSETAPETHRLRHVLIRAVESCPNSVTLWRLRLTLESYLGDRPSLKRAFYLAIRQCPWAKDLYMDAISLMPDEGQSIVDLMMEKGLRVKVPWEELQLLRKAAEQEQPKTGDSDA